MIVTAVHRGAYGGELVGRVLCHDVRGPRVFTALESLGAKMQRIGMPVHPGTLLWMASWREITIVGLPTCGWGTQVTAFDLILPKLLAEGEIRDEDLAALGHGGILSFARARILEQEAIDEPVR